MTTSTAPTTVVYIGGLGRSGSTLAERALGQLEGVVAIGELTHLWLRGREHDERCGCGEPFLRCPFWRRVGESAFGGWGAEELRSVRELQWRVERNRHILLMLAPWLWPPYRRRMRAYAAVIGRLYAAISEVSGARIVVDSSKHASSAFLRRRVPGLDLRVIHLVRDSRGVAYSWMKEVVKPEVTAGVELMDRVPPARIAIRWVVYNLLFHLLRVIGTPTRFLRYRDLALRPRTAMQGLLELMGLPSDTDLGFVSGQQLDLAPTHSVSGNPMRFRHGTVTLQLDEQWRTQLPRKDRLTVTALNWPMLWLYGLLGAHPSPSPDAPQPERWPKVSVVVATHDRPELVRRTIRSIVEQRYPGDIEVLVIHDRSPVDDALALCSAGREVRPLANSRTAGLAGARNAGAAAATGEILAFCDDDDTWLPDKLRLQIPLITADPSVSAVVGGIVIEYDHHRNARVSRREDLTYRSLLRDRATAAHPSTVIVRRRDFHEVIGLVDEAMPGSYGEDYEWLLRAARAGRIEAVAEPVATVTWGATSFFADRWQTMAEAIDYLVDKHPAFHAEPRGLARLYGRKAFALAAMGDRPTAVRWAGRTIRLNWHERRAYVALAVSLGILPAETVLRLAHSTGRGI